MYLILARWLVSRPIQSRAPCTGIIRSTFILEVGCNPRSAVSSFQPRPA